MTAQMLQVADSLSFAEEYIRHGWSLTAIPPNTKGPQHEGWNTPEGRLQTGQLPQGWGVGLCHAYSGTMALDIDEIERADAYLVAKGINLAELLFAHDAVQVSSGREGRAKLLYAMPFGMVLPSKKLHYTEADDQGKQKQLALLELRCGTREGKTVQDVLPPSIHPDTGKPYLWAGAGNWRNLPTIPIPLLDLWNSLIEKDNERSIPTEPNVIEAKWDEVVAATMSLDPNCSREEWISIGMALHSTGHPDAFELWNNWSSGSKEKYKPVEMAGQWKSFKGRADGITLNTLFSLAYKTGWKRPPPDISELFKPVSTPEQSPKAVLSKLRMELPNPRTDLSLWPSVLAKRAEEVGHEVGCDPTVPLMAGLAAVSAAADKRMRLKITNSWQVPPVLWLMTVGAPADKKTPGSKPMFAPLKKLEMEDRSRYETAMHFWKGQEARHAAQQKAYREWAASPEAGLPNSQPPQVDPLPPEPALLRLVINDATSQKVVHMAAPRPRGFLMHLDEMNHYLKKINDSKSGEDRGCWIQGYESAPYTMDRVGVGTISAENLALSIYGNCQPDVFKEQMRAGATDGLIQRFIPVVLDGTQTGMWKDSLPEFLTHAPAYEAMIRQVFALPPTEYNCSPDALEEFRDFSKWYLEGRKLDIALHASPIYMTAMGKIEGVCARVALLLHLMQNPYSLEVSGDTMYQAVTIMRRFFVLALRYAFMEVVGLKDELATWITEYIIQCSGEQATITLGDLRRSAKRIIEGRPTWQTDEEIKAIMDELAIAGYVQLFQESRRSVIWTINPALAVEFADYRKEVIITKQKKIKHFRDEGERRGWRDSRNKADAVGFDSIKDTFDSQPDT